MKSCHVVSRHITSHRCRFIIAIHSLHQQLLCTLYLVCIHNTKDIKVPAGWQPLASVSVHWCAVGSDTAMYAGTWLVLDGEAIPYKRIYAEVHKGLCRVVVA